MLIALLLARRDRTDAEQKEDPGRAGAFAVQREA
jgi:hypothetical protein